MKKLTQALLALCLVVTTSAVLPAAETGQELKVLKQQLADQQKQIDQLRAMLEAQQNLLTRFTPEAKPRVEVASLQPVIPTTSVAARKAGAFETATLTPPGPVVPTTPVPDIAKIELDVKGLNTEVGKIGKNLGGFIFSGDFRYRFDAQLRHSNSLTGALQNVRNRYRVRLNVDKELSPKFKFHFQLSTSPYVNQITNDQDFAAFGAKAPFSVAEAFMTYTPNKTLTVKVGRMKEVFADDTRFVWDDDIRFNGFEQNIMVPIKGGTFFKSMEFRAGEYILTNPNTLIVPADSAATPSPYARAGFPVGSRVGAANLYDLGVVFKGSLGGAWSHQFIFDTQVWRNPNQIALASTALAPAGLVNSALGITLSGAFAASSNGLTTAGGPKFTADGFTIPRIHYKIERPDFLTIHGKKVPGYVEFLASRNTSATFLRDAIMGNISIGSTKKPGDVRFLYSYSIKDANSLIGQFTDDDLGTQYTVNMAAHQFRVDIGLTKFLSWQNLFWIQEARRASNPAQNFFVLVPRGANTNFRYLGQFAFTF